MVKVTLAAGIESASGKTGNVQFRTFRKPDGSIETRMYLVPRAENGKYKYERSTPVSEREMQVRELFSKRQQRVNQLRADNPKLSKKKAWQIAKNEIKN